MEVSMHFKDIPSSEELLEHRILLGEMNVKLFQKIEELTLYALEQEQKIPAQEDRLEKTGTYGK